jgi:dipeptidyl aminopeptidase/acylaminoacyl peptidase
MEQTQMPPLIPRQVLLGNPDKASPRLSPDGVMLAYLAPVEGVLNVWVGPADQPLAARPLTRDRDRGIRIYFWAYTSRHVIYLQDKGGDENWRVYSVEVESGDTLDLTPLDNVHAQIQAVSPDIPAEIMVGLNDRDPQLHDLYRVDISTGERALVQKNECFSGFLTDDEYNIRFALRLTPDGGSETLAPDGKNGWDLFMKVEMEDLLTTSVTGFDKSGRVLYLTDSRGRDTAAMAAIDLDTAEESILAEDPKADVSDVMVHPETREIEAVAFTHQRKEWQVLSSSVATDLEYLRTVAGGDIEVVDRTLDDSRWIVAYLMDDGPVRYYIYDRAQQKSDFLFTNKKSLEGLPLAKMHPVIVKSRDGLDLVCYYTLPAGNEGGSDARPPRPLPLVILVHGGPWARDNWGYDPQHQLLANRGYAVLSVNFRGSTGLGKRFTNAGNLEWGRRMHYDLIDALEWAVGSGIADPDKVAIMGGSYGGYATLIGLTQTPETFACGVDIVGPSSLLTLLQSFPPYWQPQVELFASRVGDHRTEEGRALLQERSPLSYVDRIKRPLLIGQGANDPRVKVAESDQIVRAMKDKSIPVTYVLYTDEGHGFARPENRMSFYAIAEAFLATHLGGRFEPIGKDFQGSSISVPTGASHVPDLLEALPQRI